VPTEFLFRGGNSKSKGWLINSADEVDMSKGKRPFNGRRRGEGSGPIRAFGGLLDLYLSLPFVGFRKVGWVFLATIERYLRKARQPYALKPFSPGDAMLYGWKDLGCQEERYS